MRRVNRLRYPARLRQHTLGQGLVEYALILLLVAIVVIVILVMLGPQVGSVFSGVSRGMVIETPTPCVTMPGNGNIGRCI